MPPINMVFALTLQKEYKAPWSHQNFTLLHYRVNQILRHRVHKDNLLIIREINLSVAIVGKWVRLLKNAIDFMGSR